AYVFVTDARGNELFVNAELVRRGVALLYVVGENQARRDEILKAQSEAAQGGQGLWALLSEGDSAGPYVGGMGKSARHRFHRRTCDSVEDPKELKPFATKKDALLDGRSPCRKCKP
ncbi:MAG TPA: thermonuclease family protein, partial [Planctomycetota bacterium]|nr:thermonuclease family protein [Planctomycetota bacterium]